MRTMRKVQAVIYDIRNGKPYFLIFHRILHWRGWELSKETIKKGETIKQALRRGMREETGLKDFKIVKGLNKRIEFMWDKIKVIIVDVFLVKIDMKGKISLKQKRVEHDSYLWVDKRTALEKLTYKNARDIIKGLKIFK